MRKGVIAIGVVTITSCWHGRGTVSPVDTLPIYECFDLSYEPGEAAALFPRRIALAAGVDGGQARWLPDSTGSDDTWRMFQQPAHWEHINGDSIRMTFSNGFSAVRLSVVAGNLRTGTAQWLSDVVGSTAPAASLSATPIHCDSP